ncbi:UNVERIFIED_CONTAM: hypothetical protein PYX00_011056 [Menopon gallinae]|uniref:M23ase beta-sheet core domain-containing protein n=1 Tax=Menopon gallinae TaxID=328185 RepID=A0AAW2H6W9_9NEOP
MNGWQASLATLNAFSSASEFRADSSFSFPLKDFILSSDFGWRKSPISGKRVYHKGIDLAAPYGALAYPACAGTVIKVSYNSVYGHHVLVKHNNGYQSLYGHFRKVLVKEGEIVGKGQALGEVGDTDSQWASANQWQVLALRSGEYPLLLRIDPGFQSSYKDSSSTNSPHFVVKIRPIYNERGIINLEIFDQETKEALEEVRVSLADKTYTWPSKETIFQAKGIYQVLVEASGYESKSVQIQVEPGRDNYILIPLQKACTYLFFNVPSAFEVSLDAKSLSLDERQKGVKVEPGVHNLSFVLGSYKASRSLYVKEGLKYEVSFSFAFDYKEVP